MKFECALFSCFSDERETLFFGGDTVLRIKGIWQWANGKWMKYDKYMEPINAFCRMINGLSVMGQPIFSQRSSQKAMSSIFGEILRAQIGQSKDVNTPQYIQDLLLYHHSNASRVRLLYHEMLMEYQWLHWILKSQSNGTLNFANIAALFCQSDEITIMMPEDMELSKRQCSMLIKDMISISRMALDVKVRFLWPSALPEFTKGQIAKIAGSYEQYCRPQFDSQSISFITTDSTYTAKTQSRFIKRIKALIYRLSLAMRPVVEKKKTIVEQLQNS